MRALFASLGLAAALVACNRNDSGDETSAKIQEALTPADKDMPATLRETNLFIDGDPKAPVARLTSYDVKVPLWSDGAHKRRYVFVPPNATVRYDEATKSYVYPVGTTFVKTFATEAGTPVETRVITLKDDGALHFATYVSDDAGNAAINGRPRKVTVEGIEFRIPSEKECKTCHGEGTRIIAFEPRQLAVDEDGKSQFERLSQAITFEGAPKASEVKAYDDPTDTSLTVMQRARSYLNVNCSPCHNPAGPEKANTLDFRIGSADTHLREKDRLIPGDLANSKIWQLLTAEQDRMPPLNLRPDPVAFDVLRQMIEQWPKP